MGLNLSALALCGAMVALGATGCDHHHHADRQQQVRQRGQQVMPFDLNRTTHVFVKTSGGGVESVLTKARVDRSQLALIREHLHKEQQLFSRGDFSDPMAIHGMKMPGIDTLRRRADRITITYRDVPRGAELRYTTSDPQALSALYEWFDAQLIDHGSDAHP